MSEKKPYYANVKGGDRLYYTALTAGGDITLYTHKVVSATAAEFRIAPSHFTFGTMRFPRNDTPASTFLYLTAREALDARHSALVEKHALHSAALQVVERQMATTERLQAQLAEGVLQAVPTAGTP